MNRYICERRCDEGMRTFKGGLCGTIRTINAGGDKRVIVENNDKDINKVGNLLTGNSQAGTIYRTGGFPIHCVPELTDMHLVI